MGAATDSTISRRNLLRVGALTGFATALLPALRWNEARADGGVICNPDRPTTPADALLALIDGNDRWATFTQTHPGEDATRRDCVANPNNKQTPFAAIISCSDSRVPPELLFDQGVGDLFVARVAGNVGTGTLTESLFYGTDFLGSLVLFVLGHSDCGAVKAAVETPGKHALTFVNLLRPAVKAARKIVKQAGGDPTDPKQVVPVATDQNVIMEVQKLRVHKFFKKDVEAGKILIAGGVYDLATSQVNILIQ